jgi:hypothetical protein
VCPEQSLNSEPRADDRLKTSIARIRLMTTVLSGVRSPGLVTSTSESSTQGMKLFNYLADMLNTGVGKDTVVAITGVMENEGARAAIVLSSNSASPRWVSSMQTKRT